MDYLWKKEAGGGNYVNIFKNIMTSVISSRHGLQKDNKISTNLRIKGNQKFQEHSWFDAMDYYNRSLCFAENDTENVSLAYADRAKCFLKLKMYDKCLADIEMAKSMGTPNDLMAKLKKQKANCIKLMSQEQQEPDYERKLSYDASKQFPCLADVVKIQQNEEFGRHAIAMCDIPVGKAILVEEYFLSSTLSGMFIGCATCQKTRMNFIACEKCTMTIFCNEKCKKNNELHIYDCNFIYHRDQSGNKEFQMIAHSIFFALNTFEDVDELVQFIESSIKKSSTLYVPDCLDDAVSKYHLFLTLNGEADTDKMQFIPDKAKYLYTILLKLPVVSSAFDSEERRLFLKHLVTYHFVKFCKNSIVSSQNECQRIVTLGLVFPLFNHACSPNLLNFAICDTQFCITIRPVKKGDQLFVSYSCADLPTRFRQMHLMKKFGFLCKCDKCDTKYTADDVAKLVADPGFKYVKQKLNSNLLDQKNRTDVKGKCIEILNIFGHKWVPELEIILNMYIQAELYESP